MRTENFNLEKYNTGRYDVITRSGTTATIAAIDSSKGDSSVVAWINGAVYGFTIDGKFLEGETDGRDLFLREKARKVYIKITKAKDGEIIVYGRADVKPRGYKSSNVEILKELEVEV